MKKSKIMIALVILSILLTISLIIYDGFNYAPSRIKLNYRYLESQKIHPDLDGLQIAFISDIYYNNFMDKERFDNVLKKIETINPDIVIFLGDLFDEKNIDNIDDKVLEDILKQLSSIKAKYGKFAVLGENDYYNENVEAIVNEILFESNFEIIRNSMVKISKGTKNTIQLVGIDSPLNKKDDIKKAYENVSSDQFTLTILHTPDTGKLLPQKQTDLIVAGHSRGGQINIPLLGQIYNEELAEDYYSGLYNIGSINLYVTNGLGTKEVDVRIFAPAEIVVYTLRNKK